MSKPLRKDTPQAHVADFLDHVVARYVDAEIGSGAFDYIVVQRIADRLMASVNAALGRRAGRA